VECKLRCVNFRRVSDPRRAFQLVFRVTVISYDRYRRTMGVIVISSGTPWCTGGNVGCTWEHLGVPKTILGAPSTSLAAREISLGPPQITVKQSGNNFILFGNAAGAPGNYSY